MFQKLKMNTTVDNQSMNKRNPFLYILIIIVIALVIGLGIIGKLYFDSRQQISSLKNGSTDPLATLSEIKTLTEKIGQHYVLPKEQPKLVTIANVENLKKNQPFFAQAKNGDKLLVYSQKVILYDPVADKIIDVAQIRIPEEISNPTRAPSTIPTKTATEGGTIEP